jgi:tRNA 5-methylaminomethyl-2-thiouridine biosynthesis bifunctional protein
LEVAYKDSLIKRQQTFDELNAWPKELIHSVSNQEATKLAGIEVNHGGLFMPNAGWAYPVDLVNKLFDAAKATKKIKIKTNTKITKIVQNPTNKHWRLHTDSKIDNLADENSGHKEGNHKYFDANVLVICAGADSIGIEQVQSLPLTATRGQVTSMKSNKASKNLSTVICHKGYLTPENNGQHCIGATFQKNNTSLVPSPEDDQYNLNMINKCLPKLTKYIDWQTQDIVTSKARLRCMSQDHLPLVGAMPDIEQHIQSYSHLAKDKNWPYKQPAPCISNLYVFLGLGARGLCSAPLAADILTAELCGTPYPVDNNMLFNLNPNRFVIRDIIKRKTHC